MSECVLCDSVKAEINFFYYSGNYTLSSVSTTRLKLLIKVSSDLQLAKAKRYLSTPY